MKRILHFKSVDENYVCVENDETVFSISSITLQFDVKAFYQAFYGDDKDYDEIELVNCVDGDAKARRVYSTIQALLDSIKTKLGELASENADDIECTE